MTTISTPRSLQIAWTTPWATAPPSSCATLILGSSTVSYGGVCVFSEEESNPATVTPYNTACLPWLAGATPPSNAFYSPATACPSSWSAVATSTSGGDQWVDGETALSCCPNGLEDGGGGTCKPASTGTFVVLECGDADAEENDLRTYSGRRWPETATVNVPVLQLRFQASDLGSTSSASSTSSRESPSAGNNEQGSGGSGLSTGEKAAIGTVIPLALIVIALAAFLLWRRRKRNMAAARQDKAFEETKSQTGSDVRALEAGSSNSKAPITGVAIETPEWNTELDATEAERRDSSPTQNSAHASVNELGGIARRPRKPIPAVELDGTPVVPEMDVSQYMAYQPPRGTNS